MRWAARVEGVLGLGATAIGSTSSTRWEVVAPSPCSTLLLPQLPWIITLNGYANGLIYNDLGASSILG